MGSDCSLGLAHCMRQRSEGVRVLMSLSPIVDRDPQQETRSRDVSECTAAAGLLRKAPSFRVVVGCLYVGKRKPLMVKRVMEFQFTSVNRVENWFGTILVTNYTRACFKSLIYNCISSNGPVNRCRCTPHGRNIHIILGYGPNNPHSHFAGTLMRQSSIRM